MKHASQNTHSVFWHDTGNLDHEFSCAAYVDWCHRHNHRFGLPELSPDRPRSGIFWVPLKAFESHLCVMRMALGLACIRIRISTLYTQKWETRFVFLCSASKKISIVAFVHFLREDCKEHARNQKTTVLDPSNVSLQHRHSARKCADFCHVGYRQTITREWEYRSITALLCCTNVSRNCRFE